MKKEKALVFHHPQFEAEVRQQLQIFDRPIDPSDAAKVTQLELYAVDTKRPFDLKKLHRFHQCDICEMLINGKEI
ncbi:MAG: hypothetical protein J6J43_07170 [Oscillospiraceae bacterium]|nr:hypothetical protein [Oscillospiraceae bacterium]